MVFKTLLDDDGFEFETLMQVTGILADCEGSKFGGPFFFLFLPILNMSWLSVCSCLTVRSLHGFNVRFRKGSFNLERDIFLMSHFQFHFTLLSCFINSLNMCTYNQEMSTYCIQITKKKENYPPPPLRPHSHAPHPPFSILLCVCYTRFYVQFTLSIMEGGGGGGGGEEKRVSAC